MQAPGEDKPPVGILFDCDMGNTIDAALALALLYGLDGLNEARVVSVSVTNSNLKAAAFCDVVARFYAGASKGAFMRALAVGLSTDGKVSEDTPMLVAPLSKRNAAGELVYYHAMQRVSDTSEVSALIRNALTSQADRDAIVVLAGPATNLARALELRGVKDLIARKVKFLSIAAGAYRDERPEPHITADIPAARKLFAEWPTPVVALGREMDGALLFPASSIERDFAWSPDHPIVDAYRAYKPMPYDAPTWAMSAALYAVRAQAGYFQQSEPGTITVLDDGRTKFTPSPEGKHRYLIFDPSRKGEIIEAYTKIASAKPVIRKPRFPLLEQKKEPPKAPEAKDVSLEKRTPGSH